MNLDAGNLGWEAHRCDPNGAELDLDSDEAMESHQTLSAWMCGPELKTLFRLAKVSGLQTPWLPLLLMHNEWLQGCNIFFNKISSLLIAFSTFLPSYHSPLENTYSDYSGVNISSRRSNWIHPSHWMPAPWMAMMGNPTSSTFLSHMTCLHSILKKQKMSQGLL